MKKNGVFIFVISQIVPEIFTIFVLCKKGTDDVIGVTVWKSKHKIGNISASNTAMKFKIRQKVLTLKCNYNSLKICGALWDNYAYFLGN